MKCSACKICREHPRNPDRCIYGGPFEFLDRRTRAGLLASERIAAEQAVSLYWSVSPMGPIQTDPMEPAGGGVNHVYRM